MNLPDMDWKPIPKLFTCTPIDHPEYIMPFGQIADIDFKTDNSQSYCLNRGDANPFLNGTEADSKTWTQWLNTPCPETIRNRRCLGSRPDLCVNAFCKYKLITII